MSVITVQNGNNLLGTLGTLATLGGGLTGSPLLGALGSGMSAVNSAMKGDAAGTAQALGGFNNAGGLSQILTSLKNMFNPIAGSQQQQQQLQQQQNNSMWSPFLNRSNIYTGVL